jgi:hypothetical protein
MIIPFCGPTYNSVSPNFNCSRSVNLYPELAPDGRSKAIIALVGTPGTELWAALGKNVIRGMHAFNGLLYVVSGNSLYSVSPAGVVSSSLGTLASEVGRVQMKNNGLAAAGIGGDQLMITDGANGYIYNVSLGTFVILNNPARYTITGAVTTGIFINQETVTQATSSATAILAGTVSSSGPVTVTNIKGSADNSHVWTGSTSGATFTPSASPTLGTATSFPGNPVTLDYIDGYFVVGVAGSMSAYASNLYDGTTWNALATSPISASPDPIQCVFNLHQQLWIIKTHTSEVWYDAGIATSAGFPFNRQSGAVVDYGTVAPWSVARGDNGIFFLASARNNDTGEIVGVVEITGGVPQIISTSAIAYQIGQFATVSDAFGYCYTENGHTFYVLTFPSANATFVYDASTLMWHERSTWTGSPYVIGRHVGNCYAHFNGAHLVGDYASGNIYRMASGLYTDNGQPIVAMRTAQVLFDNQGFEGIAIQRLVVDCEMGVGGGASLSWSKDGGHTWSNEHAASLGAVGQYGSRLVWRKLGYFSNGFIPRLTISDPCKRVILGAYAEVES